MSSKLVKVYSPTQQCYVQADVLKELGFKQEHIDSKTGIAVLLGAYTMVFKYAQLHERVKWLEDKCLHKDLTVGADLMVWWSPRANSFIWNPSRIEDPDMGKMLERFAPFRDIADIKKVTTLFNSKLTVLKGPV